MDYTLFYEILIKKHIIHFFALFLWNGHIIFVNIMLYPAYLIDYTSLVLFSIFSILF